MSPLSGSLPLLRELASEDVMDLVRRRLLCGYRFFDKNTLRPGLDRGDAKLAMLLVLAANPNEALTAAEKALVDGRQQEHSARERENAAREQENSALPKKGKNRP